MTELRSRLAEEAEPQRRLVEGVAERLDASGWAEARKRLVQRGAPEEQPSPASPTHS